MGLLSNIKVIELAGLAPVPMVGMILSDYGAKVIRVDNSRMFFNDEVLNRGKQSICLNLKKPNEANIFRRLLRNADIMLDPYRPGVLERLSLAPLELQKDNPGLIIARLTGYGQVRPGDRPEIVRLKNSPGHDLNYLAMSGVLSRLGTDDRPHAPVNMLADFGGGAMSCVNGVLAALVARASSGRGTIIDCSMTLASAYLCSFLWRGRDKASFLWPDASRRGANVLDGGAPFYRCYQTSDKRFLAVAALEPHFYRSLLSLLAVPEDEAPQNDCALWPAISERFSRIFAGQSEREWLDRVECEAECCVTAVLDLDEAARFWDEGFLVDGGHREPGPQPRFSESTAPPSTRRPKVGGDTEVILREAGCSEDEIRAVIDGDPSAKL